MWKSLASNMLTLLVVGFMALAAVLGWSRQQYMGPGPLAQAICFEVEKGANLTKVSKALEAKGVISQGWIFRVGAGYSDKAGELKFGSYLLGEGASMAQVLGALTAGGQSTCGREVNFRIGVASADIVLRELDPATGRYEDLTKFDPLQDVPPPQYLDKDWLEDVRWRVTLAEGVTSWQVVEALKIADFLGGDVAEVPPEGSLSPDSYEIVQGTERSAIIAEMQARQTQILADAWANRAAGLPYESPEAALVMASIVEKETGVTSERKKVASVFLNRIEQGMKLQTDPTVIYGVTKGQGVLGRGLRQSELKRETPWNTYVIDGLPPTPIANPGRLSIEAALNPETTKYLFFVADGTGGHAFAETLQEHNDNVKAWREIEAKAAKEAEAAGDGG